MAEACKGPKDGWHWMPSPKKASRGGWAISYGISLKGKTYHLDGDETSDVVSWRCFLQLVNGHLGIQSALHRGQGGGAASVGGHLSGFSIPHTEAKLQHTWSPQKLDLLPH
jgi:hypothetical protein